MSAGTKQVRWIGAAGNTVSENELREGWAKLQKKVADLRTDD